MSQHTKTPKRPARARVQPTRKEEAADYAIYRHSSLQPLDKLSLHVLARAYRSAWRVMYNCEPLGRHAIEPLDLVIEFRG